MCTSLADSWGGNDTYLTRCYKWLAIAWCGDILMDPHQKICLCPRLLRLR